MTADFPFDGELFLAKNKKHSPLVFFVHFYQGHKKALRRHIEFVNSLGFDAFAFNLQGFDFQKPLLQEKWPISTYGEFGTKHVYADQIELLLNLLPQKKIIFSFSNLCGSSIEAMARRQCSDVLGLICDSGPSGKFINSAYNLTLHQFKLKTMLLRFAVAPLVALGWSPYLHKDIQKNLSQFPDHFPILSIAGWRDPLIPPSHIEAVFEDQPHLDWQNISLAEAAHLNGLRDFPDEYKPPVERFLLGLAAR
jgi:hypothetical protein